MRFDVLPEGFNVIGSGRIYSDRDYYDLLTAHKRDGYTHHIRALPLEKWWEIALVAKVTEGADGVALQKGCILLFYCGTEASFLQWQKETMDRIEQVAEQRHNAVQPSGLV